MTQSAVNFPMGGGLNRAKASHLSAIEDFWDMLNFRPARNNDGAVEQTPYFTQSVQLAQGTCYVGGSSISEISASRVRGLFDYGPSRRLVLTDFVVWAGTVGALAQQQIFEQTLSVGSAAIPTLQTGCYITIGSVSTAAITLGNSIDIEIDGAATFKWRINGGAYTTLVPIAMGGVTLGATTIKVYFLATTGYTIGHWWKWSRIDQYITPLDSSTATGASICTDFVMFNNNVYFSNPNNARIYTLINNSSTNSYVISAGYRPISGRHLVNFANHLGVVGLSMNYANDVYANRAVCTGFGWSDRGDFDNFISSDTNEADIYYFPTQFVDNLNLTPQVLGAAVIGTQLYVFLHDSIWKTSYLGLPTVFNFEKCADLAMQPSASYTNGCTVFRAANVVMLWNYAGLYLFDGVNLENVGDAVNHYLNSQTNFYSFAYLGGENELYLAMSDGILGFQLNTKKWHRRSSNFSAEINCLGKSWDESTLLVGHGTRKVLVEDVSWAAAPVYDASTGTAFATPTLTKHLFANGSFLRTKELTGLIHVAAEVVAASTTYYSTDNDALLGLYHRTITPGTISSKFPTTATSASLTWKLSNTSAQLSGPRMTFRAVALEWQVTGAVGGKPPGQLVVYGFEVDVRGMKETEK